MPCACHQGAVAHYFTQEASSPHRTRVRFQYGGITGENRERVVDVSRPPTGVSREKGAGISDGHDVTRDSMAPCNPAATPLWPRHRLLGACVRCSRLRDKSDAVKTTLDLGRQDGSPSWIPTTLAGENCGRRDVQVSAALPTSQMNCVDLI